MVVLVFSCHTLHKMLAQSPFVSFTLSQGQVLESLFGIVFFVWVIYSIVIVYHWIRYGHRSPIGVSALIAHFVISLGLFLLAASGFA